MRSARTTPLAGAAVAALVLTAAAPSASAGDAAPSPPTPTVVASGLANPRQLTVGPKGELYVAEAGRGGTTNCQQTQEFGRVCLGLTGALAKVGTRGKVSRVVTGLPSTVSASGEATGPSDVAFSGPHRFALVIGLAGTPSYRSAFGRTAQLLGTVATGDLRRHRSRPLSKAFDIAGYEATHSPDRGGVDSNGTGIARARNGWVVADAGGNDVVSTRRRGGTVAVLPSIPTTKPGPVPVGSLAQSVPTDVVRGPDGAYYVSELVGFPFEKGSASIWRIMPGRTPTRYATGLTNVTSLAFDRRGQLYAVELASEGLLTGPTGTVVKVTRGGSTHQVVAGGLFAPYGVAIRGRDAYVTTGSVSPTQGQVIRVRL